MTTVLWFGLLPGGVIAILWRIVRYIDGRERVEYRWREGGCS